MPTTRPVGSDTSHIFRDAAGDRTEDTPANRALIQGAVVGREDRRRPVWPRQQRAATAVLGAAPVVRSDYGWMDSGILVEAGIPCVILGPTGDGLHTSDEWVDLASVDACVDIFERMARELCG
jgi:acetylornithine deacetylase/succinyl-diaminopimelate desuccinylase-like protein